ncbi:MAG: isoprenyl transferase [Bacteroidales bacterium]|nr:isoprenyl transferase [Bacteroidales bacterium]
MSISDIDLTHLPQHIAIIMDGNGRWAKERGLERMYGHQAGADAVRKIVETTGKLQIPYLTLYAFSTENWNRPRTEVDALMTLLVSAIQNELDNLMQNQVRLNVIGNVDDLPEACQQELIAATHKTSQNKGLTLTLALSYSGRWEITRMVTQIAQLVENGQLAAKDITPEKIAATLNAHPLPDPDILIRTGGESRISNFLLWQIAYTELFFVDTKWPDFAENDLLKIILQFQNRERRFGKTSEQIKSC